MICSSTKGRHGGARPGSGRKPGPIGVADRLKRYQLAEKSAKYTEEIIDYYVSVFQGESLPHGLRMEAAERLLNRAYGRPPVVDVDGNEERPRVVLEVRWLPPDPNDRSRLIEPEP